MESNTQTSTSHEDSARSQSLSSGDRLQQPSTADSESDDENDVGGGDNSDDNESQSDDDSSSSASGNKVKCKKTLNSIKPRKYRRKADVEVKEDLKPK